MYYIVNVLLEIKLWKYFYHQYKFVEPINFIKIIKTLSIHTKNL